MKTTPWRAGGRWAGGSSASGCRTGARAPGARRWTALAGALALGLAACEVDDPGITPPRDRLFFPTGVAVDPAGDLLYVTNGNADLRWAAGTLVALDLGRLRADLAAARGGALPAEAGSLCRFAPDQADLLECDESRYIRGAVQIGSFAGDIALQAVPDRAEAGRVIARRRLHVAVRGEPSITWIDVLREGPSVLLDCVGSDVSPDEAFARCDTGHRVDRIAATAEVLDPEPFALALDEPLGLLYVTHLSEGSLSVIDVALPPRPPRLVDRAPDVFVDAQHGREGTSGVAARPCRAFTVAREGGTEDVLAGGPGCTADQATRRPLVYVTSPLLDVIRQVAIAGAGGPCADPSSPCQGAREIVAVPGAAVDPEVVSPASQSQGDARALAFAPDGREAYVLVREPPALLVLDTTLEAGAPRNRARAVIGLGAEPSQIALRETAAGRRALVVCFAAGQIYEVDVETARVARIIEVGAGPASIAVVEGPQPLLFVANFLESTVGVVDLEEGSPTAGLEVAKMGFPGRGEVIR